MSSAWKSVDVVDARSWVEASLCDGTGIANELVSQLHEFANAQVLVPADWLNREFSLDGTGRGLRVEGLGEKLNFRVVELAAGRRRTVIVEDELRRPGDRNLGGTYSIYGDRVLHWVKIPGGDVWSTIRAGSSGYPLNAYVCDTELAPGALISPFQASGIITSTDVIVVSVFDGETLLVLHR